jgi:hypothetical protein
VGEREAFVQNQEEFKRANERLEQAVAGVVTADREVPFVCECLDVTCTGNVAMTIAEYRAMRAHNRRFAIIPGHPTLDEERVVEENDRYQLVEKPDDQP